MIERLRGRLPAGAAGEFSSPESTLWSESYPVPTDVWSDKSEGGAHVFKHPLEHFSLSHLCTVKLVPSMSECARKGNDSELSDNTAGRKRGVC